MNMTIKEWEIYRIYKRREDLLGNPFIAESDEDITQIDKFLKIVENYINLKSIQYGTNGHN